MMNLLPPEEKEVLVQEFRFRSAALFCASLAFGVFSAALVLLPGLFSLRADAAVHEQLLASTKARNEESASSAIERDAELLNKRLSVVQASFKKEPALVSRVVETVLEANTPGITLSSLQYVRIAPPDAVPKLELGGVAPTREALLSFVAVLQKNTAFARVDAPISLLARKTNLPFTVSADVVFVEP